MSRSIRRLIEVKKREQGAWRIIAIERNFTLLREELDRLNVLFADFVPIRCATLLEVSVRAAVKQAVDHGEPYTQRGIELIARWSGRDLASALHAMHKRSLTVGDLARQGFSTGRMDDILFALERIFGKDLRAELAAARERWIEDEREGVEAPPFIVDLEATIDHLNRLLQVRHIIVHEIPRQRPYFQEELPLFIHHARQFVLALEWVLVARFHGTVPRTHPEMNKMALEKVAELQRELDGLRAGTAEDFNSPQTPEAEVEYHWDRFCELSAALHAGYLHEEQPGSLAPCMYSEEFLRLAQWRIDDIKRQRDEDEE